MSTLRSDLIKLAHEDPAIRTHLLRILRASEEAVILKGLFKQYKKDHPGTKRPPKYLEEKAKEMARERKEKAEEKGGKGKGKKEAPSGAGVSLPKETVDQIMRHLEDTSGANVNAVKRVLQNIPPGALKDKDSFEKHTDDLAEALTEIQKEKDLGKADKMLRDFEQKHPNLLSDKDREKIQKGEKPGIASGLYWAYKEWPAISRGRAETRKKSPTKKPSQEQAGQQKAKKLRERQKADFDKLRKQNVSLHKMFDEKDWLEFRKDPDVKEYFDLVGNKMFTFKEDIKKEKEAPEEFAFSDWKEMKGKADKLWGKIMDKAKDVKSFKPPKGKEASLRAALLRLAHEDPALRPHLLRVLRGAEKPKKPSLKDFEKAVKDFLEKPEVKEKLEGGGEKKAHRRRLAVKYYKDEDSRRRYLEEHKGADPDLHVVKKPEGGGKEEAKGKAPAGKEDSEAKGERLTAEFEKKLDAGTATVSDASNVVVNDVLDGYRKMSPAEKKNLADGAAKAVLNAWQELGMGARDADEAVGQVARELKAFAPLKIDDEEEAMGFATIAAYTQVLIETHGTKPFGLPDGFSFEPADKAPAKPKTKSYTKSYAKAVTTVMDKHDLTDDDADEVKKFAKGKPPKGKKLTDAEKL
ncbi:MAG: hypothetical protein ACYTFG_19145, partial [Planctomycetota bacterium]